MENDEKFHEISKYLSKELEKVEEVSKVSLNSLEHLQLTVELITRMFEVSIIFFQFYILTRKVPKLPKINPTKLEKFPKKFRN